MSIIMLIAGLGLCWFGVVFWPKSSFSVIRISGLAAAGVLVILMSGSLRLLRAQIKVKLFHRQPCVIRCNLGRVETTALVFYIGGAVIAVLELGIAAVLSKSLWSIAIVTPFGFPLYAPVFFGSVIVSTLGLIVSLLTASKKSRGLEQRMQALVQGLT